MSTKTLCIHVRAKLQSLASTTCTALKRKISLVIFQVFRCQWHYKQYCHWRSVRGSMEAGKWNGQNVAIANCLSLRRIAPIQKITMIRPRRDDSASSFARCIRVQQQGGAKKVPPAE